MSNPDEASLLNTALSYCSIGHIPFEEKITRRTFGYGIDALNIIGSENAQKFETVIDKLLVGDIAKKITTKDLTQIVIGKIKEKLLKNEKFSTADGRAFRQELKDIKTKEILSALETATDMCEDAANVIDSIIVKMA